MWYKINLVQTQRKIDVLNNNETCYEVDDFEIQCTDDEVQAFYKFLKKIHRHSLMIQGYYHLFTHKYSIFN